MKQNVFKIVLAAFVALLPMRAHALPFNDDMVDNVMGTGRVMRPLPNDTISSGSLKYHIVSREDAIKLTNPTKSDKFSVLTGKRLFQVNCKPCHGDIGATPYVPGTVTKYLPGPNLSLPAYGDKPDGRTDGSIYGTIHFGSISGLMSAVGYKLSPTEHWDLINYIRSVQQAAAQK